MFVCLDFWIAYNKPTMSWSIALRHYVTNEYSNSNFLTFENRQQSNKRHSNDLLFSFPFIWICEWRSKQNAFTSAVRIYHTHMNNHQHISSSSSFFSADSFLTHFNSFTFSFSSSLIFFSSSIWFDVFLFWLICVCVCVCKRLEIGKLPFDFTSLFFVLLVLISIAGRDPIEDTDAYT